MKLLIFTVCGLSLTLKGRLNEYKWILYLWYFFRCLLFGSILLLVKGYELFCWQIYDERFGVCFICDCASWEPTVIVEYQFNIAKQFAMIYNGTSCNKIYLDKSWKTEGPAWNVTRIHKDKRYLGCILFYEC